ncbi:CG0192-related protein [Citricoccus alkalitolerans]|uniref:Maltokinase N-terminal cap domain-containing protein n=1 Tax=Citricoccus alkalitolerans TaxID=246603 RepID=A0ABV8Y0K8_9MICC
MATVYQATLVPSKQELLESWLAQQPWSGEGELVRVGAYRYDDPDGEVGVEGHLVHRDGSDQVLHVPMSYRGAPLEGAEPYLIGTVDHSVLGQRWVYDAMADPVATACFQRALDGLQQQAEVHLYEEDGQYIGHEADEVSVTVLGPLADQAGRVQVHRVVADPETAGSEHLAESRRLWATWPGGGGIIFSLNTDDPA